MMPKKILFYFFFGFCPIIIMIFPGLIFKPLDYKNLNESDLSILHLNFISTINRHQQIYFAKKLSFRENLYLFFESDKTYIEEKSNYYKNFIVITDDIALIYAIPRQKYDRKKLLGIYLGEKKNQPFYSYVGAVFIPSKIKQKNNQEKLSFKSDTIICKSNTIGIVKPNQPILKDGFLFCGEGTQKIQ